MSASSSLSRLEFVLNNSSNSSVELQEQQTNGASASTNGSGGMVKSLSGLVPSWMNGSKSSSSLPAPAGASAAGAAGGSRAAAAASASALASSAAASAQHAAARVGHSASEWFGQLQSKVTGKEHVPTAAPIAVAGGGGDIEEGSTLLPSSDPGGPTSALAAQFSAEFSALTSLSWKQRLVAFAMCATCGVVMLSLSFMYLSLVFVGSPAKFSLCYAMANLFLMASSLFLVGPTKQLSQMFNAQRAPVSAVYIASLLLLFYVSWQWRSFFIVVPVLIVQFASLAAYVLSYIPFGQGMMKRICSWTVGRHLNFITAS